MPHRHHQQRPLAQGLLQHQVAAHLVPHLSDRALHCRPRLPHHVLHRRHLQADIRALQARLSHQPHRPEALQLPHRRAHLVGLAQRLAMDHCRVHARALPRRLLSPLVQRHLQAARRQTPRHSHTLLLRAHIALRAHTQQRLLRAQTVDRWWAAWRRSVTQVEHTSVVVVLLLLLAHKQQASAAIHDSEYQHACHVRSASTTATASTAAAASAAAAFAIHHAEIPAAAASASARKSAILPQNVRHLDRLSHHLLVLHACVHHTHHCGAHPAREHTQHAHHQEAAQVGRPVDDGQARAARAGDELQGDQGPQAANRESQDHVDALHHLAHVHLAHAATHDRLLSGEQQAHAQSNRADTTPRRRDSLLAQSLHQLLLVRHIAQELSTRAQGQDALQLL